MTTIGATMIRQRSVNMIGAGGRRDQEALAWQAAVIANGGTVSAGRLAIVKTFIASEKSAGTWALTDDYWGLWGENAAQALTSLKQRRLATEVAAPTFTADRGYAFNGTSNYLNTGFSISAHGTAITGTNMRIAVYQRNDVATASPPMGCSETATRACFMRTRGATNFPTLHLNCTIVNGGSTVANSLGFTAVSRTPVPVGEIYKNGASLGTVAVASPTSTRPTQALYIGCNNANGTAATFTTAALGFALVGGALSAAQEAAQYNNVQAWAAAIGAASDPDAVTWAAQVVTNGGTVSAARLDIVSSFIAAEKAAGTWQLTDDYWGLWAENAPQALTSLKQKRLATATAAPTFTADRGYAFNGTTQHIDSGFVPSTMAVAMLVTDSRIAVYERTDLALGTYAAGIHVSTSRSLRLLPRTTTPVAVVGANHAAAQYTLPVADSRGFTAGSRAPGNVTAGYKNGVAMVQAVAPASYGTPIVDVALFIGAFNTAGAAGGWRATQIGFVCTGASLTPAQELAQYNNVQAWATAVGASV